MTTVELESLLFKATVHEIHLLSRRSKDPITIEESLERLRPPCDFRNLRFSEAVRVEGFAYSFRLKISSALLGTNAALAKSFELSELSWTFSLPPYDYGVEDYDLTRPDYTGPMELRPEEGAAEWLSRGKLVLVNSSPKMQISSITPLESLLLS